MKIAAHVLAYNVDRFLPSVLRNIEPYVDIIYVAHSAKPWGYVKDARDTLANPTTLKFVEQASNFSDKIEIVSGDWLTEDDMRNACLNRAKMAGCKWLIIQDADEFYTDSSYKQLLRIMEENESHDLLVTTWYNFWKSSEFVIVNADGSIKGTNAGFAVRCNDNVRFTRKRIANTLNRLDLDCPCYHYGYVMSDEEMGRKLSTWGHASQVNQKKWFKYKWLYWNTTTKFLHATNETAWLKAVRFPLEQPAFAIEFALPVKKRFVTVEVFFGAHLYNFQIRIKDVLKSFKSFVKMILRKESKN